MNTIKGKITEIHSSGMVYLIDVDVENTMFSVILIESFRLPEWIHVGNRVSLIFKESEVSLAKNLYGDISLRNRMKSTVTRIESGDLLSCVYFNFQGYELCSSITTRAVKALSIAKGDAIEALVKSNEISLVK